MADDGIIKLVENDFFFNFKQINEFLNKTSYEAISIMVFFQVIAISFIIGRFSTLYLLMWISSTFLIYNIAGPFFCLKWMLVFSSLIWHFLLFLWTHPYLIACVILIYGAYSIVSIWSSYAKEDEKELHKILALEKLESIEEKTKAMKQELERLSMEVRSLQDQRGGDHASFVSEWLNDVPYPLDRRREAAKSHQGTPSRFRS
uniref:Uncharacterized protein n=1 Tax=Clytia hemisphaerica TaxID=252671 RepID=A0A7M5XFP1_9CNID|eukprot:TCONS_00022687-protein